MNRMRCRLILDGPAGGAWNMAVDEALLETALTADATPALRWYAWAEPTLSLGYFQSWHDRPAELARLSTVRRITGGGAILHETERTYALVLPAGAWPLKDHRAMVGHFHRVAAECLDGCLVSADDGERAFLCFQRRGPNDVVRGGNKLLGSAQRNRRGALLQHGSLLPSAPAAIEEIVEAITTRLSREWCWSLVPAPLSDEERRTARRLEVEKYGAAGWNRRR